MSKNNDEENSDTVSVSEILERQEQKEHEENKRLRYVLEYINSRSGRDLDMAADPKGYIEKVKHKGVIAYSAEIARSFFEYSPAFLKEKSHNFADWTKNTLHVSYWFVLYLPRIILTVPFFMVEVIKRAWKKLFPSKRE